MDENNVLRKIVFDASDSSFSYWTQSTVIIIAVGQAANATSIPSSILLEIKFLVEGSGYYSKRTEVKLEVVKDRSE